VNTFWLRAYSFLKTKILTNLKVCALNFLLEFVLNVKLVKKLYNGDWLDWIIRKVNTFLVKNGKFPYKPFLNDEFRDHEGIAELKECFDVIQEELLEASKGAAPIQGDLFFDEDVTDDGKWHRVHLQWYGNPFMRGKKTCPRTMSIISRHKDIRLAMVSILKPNAVIKPHFGPWAGSYRCLLGIQTPNSPRCAITVGGQKAWWQDGEEMWFDDTFEHSVTNATSQHRIVLFMDIERPMKNKFYTAIRWILNRTVTKFTARE